METDWPAPNVWLTRQVQNHTLTGPIGWTGTLIDGMRDNSGQVYMRNRYYDPASGRFTQEDPTGLAGGLNVYGFDNGDPVTFSDPYGLDVILKGPHVQAIVAYLRHHSRSFDRVYRALDRDHSIRLVVFDMTDPVDQRNATTGFVPPTRLGDSGRIQYNPTEDVLGNQDYARIYGSRFTWRFTPLSAIAHEFGHAAAYFKIPGIPKECAGDPDPGDTGCIIDFENLIRGELPADHRSGTRTFY
jgi:RHS repeat-associated protein